MGASISRGGLCPAQPPPPRVQILPGTEPPAVADTASWLSSQSSGYHPCSIQCSPDQCLGAKAEDRSWAFKCCVNITSLNTHMADLHEPKSQLRLKGVVHTHTHIYLAAQRAICLGPGGLAVWSKGEVRWSDSWEACITWPHSSSVKPK